VYVNGKIIPVETIPVMWGRRDKENGGGSELKYIVRTFVNVTVYSHQAQQ
jgi:hypothetical protein